MSVAIETTGLTKYYGRTRGIEDLDLEVPAGGIFGYLGPNGAGKTTTIRLLLDFIRPTRGTARALGFDSHSQSMEIRRATGYLPGELALYERMSARELLAFFGRLRHEFDAAYVSKLAERLQLNLDSPISALSKGNKQKVGVLQALMNRPQLLILDEPTSSLDPLVQHEVHTLLKEAAGEGRTVFLSSHVLSEVEEVADRVGIVREGTLVAVEEIRILKERARRRLEVRFATAVGADSFERIPGVKQVVMDGDRFQFTVEGSIDPLIKAIAQHEVEHLESREADLEEIFFAYYRGESEDAA
jgi:ABC-2 type transport system ATP-binding protein